MTDKDIICKVYMDKWLCTFGMTNWHEDQKLALNLMTKLQFKTMVLILCQVFWNSSIFEPSTYWYSSHNSVMSSSLIICFFLCLSFQEYYCTVYPLFLFLFMFQSLMLRQDVVKYTLSYVKICKTDRTCVQVVGVCVCVCVCVHAHMRVCMHACTYACDHMWHETLILYRGWAYTVHLELHAVHAYHYISDPNTSTKTTQPGPSLLAENQKESQILPAGNYMRLLYRIKYFGKAITNTAVDHLTHCGGPLFTRKAMLPSAWIVTR